jgi:hypothetical protein
MSPLEIVGGPRKLDLPTRRGRPERFPSTSGTRGAERHRVEGLTASGSVQRGSP